MKVAPFSYYAPTTIDEAVALLGEFADDGGRIIAGGQSFVPMMAFRLARPSQLIDINGIAALSALTIEDGVLRIGAIVRHSTLETMTIAGPLGRLLSNVAGSVAHLPIRNRGTFCGSLVHADPSAEWCLVAATLSGAIVARSARATREMPAADFLQGIMTTDLAAEELVTECRIPLLPDDTRFGFHEVSRRAGDFAMAAGLVTYRLDGGRMADVRVGIGGVEPCPRRLDQVEAMLTGAVPDAARFDAAAALAASAVDPMEDHNNTPAFRRQLTRAVIRRAFDASLPGKSLS